jgi:rare lipoprotein A (peptidoglycan hydrolase)
LSPTIRDDTDLHSLIQPISLAWRRDPHCSGEGECPAKGENDAMPMRRTIGISLACLVISAGAIAKTPDKNRVHHHNLKHAKADVRIGKTRTFSCNAGGGPPDTYLGPMHPVGASQIGTAAWYNLVGSRTSSGEVLDTVTPTAAHRTLPLASYAKVTNLDSGRSIIVKINDRGPWHRRFIIDLSPRAAGEIGVRNAGVAPVVVEPVAFGSTGNNAGVTTATFQSPAVPAAQ